MLKSGIYEQVINKKIETELTSRDDIRELREVIDKEEAPLVLSKYMAELIEKNLTQIKESKGDLSEQIEYINKLISSIECGSEEDNINSGEQLLAVINKKNSMQSVDSHAEVVRPETSIARSSLLTGSPNEPSMFTELKKEILSANKIDMLVSFIKWSGLVKIIDELRTFTQNGSKLRIITTSYMGATDIKAVKELSRLSNTEIKVSYDTKRTRLHAKSYIFYRETGFTTAYVGSSNLSNAAISSGLEWNVKVTAKDLPDTIQKINATFESYWNSAEFEDYSEGQSERLATALKAEKYVGTSDRKYVFDIIPYSYQQQILDRLNAEREVRGSFKNLVVAATGTGKTVISAFDYKNFCRNNSGQVNRLLFVAHREEILKQSLETFRGILRDPNFGDLFVGGHRPESIDHLFISVQTFYSQDFYDKTTEDFYDYIIVDEFHHAAAPTYQNLLTYYKPKILLGLTATPERMDGKSILEYFDNRIAAEIRLPEAIDRKLLCPFQYFGLIDTVDLSSLKWSRGGYDKKELSNVYTISSYAAHRRADLIINAVDKYVADMDEVKGLGFCVSVEHAKFMSECFNKAGISSIHLTGFSADYERNTAKKRLQSGEIKFIFVVNIYNEGVDIPEVNTILFLRPTESLTVFLQQFGRGLRISDNKDCLTVLDFIGQANKKYNFEEKFAALLSSTEKNVQREIKNGFISVPKGCYIHLEKKAREYILSNIKSAFNSRNGLISRIATFEEDSGLKLSLENFVSYYHIDVRSIYKNNSFSRLCVSAGVMNDFSEEIEDELTSAFSRICAIDSRRWLKFLIDMLEGQGRTYFTDNEIRMLKMFNYTIWNKTDEEKGFNNVYDGIELIRKSKVMKNELIELLKYNYNHIDFIDEEIQPGFECPLDLYCTYSKAQLLLALDFKNPSAMREGVKYLPDKKTDVLMVTLNKSDKDYSPSTMYNDYSINDTLFHWQTQSTTTPESATGQRYINHRRNGTNVMLFVRDEKKDSFGLTPGYTFLGLADYVRSDGSTPMNIVWKLHKPMPAKHLRKTNKLVI